MPINLEKSARFRIIPVMLDDVPLRGVMRMMLGGYQSVTVSELKKERQRDPKTGSRYP